ncbi:RlpA-like double-psi beta-barrel-protein domain-containing protein-containing protein [Parasitella parasitica]|nr:RlpA-like double-psi beta-barrel-protein domain-containing protein-containing protein [Parasitella parasitica]
MTGLGSCGKVSKDTDLMVALNAPQMEGGRAPKDLNNNNPLCGKYIIAKGPKGSVRVKVLDTCPPCAKGSLDFSAAAYAKLGDYDDGEIKITWKWE